MTTCTGYLSNKDLCQMHTKQICIQLRNASPLNPQKIGCSNTVVMVATSGFNLLGGSFSPKHSSFPYNFFPNCNI